MENFKLIITIIIGITTNKVSCNPPIFSVDVNIPSAITLSLYSNFRPIFQAYYKKLYTVLSCLGVFTFCTCCILTCLVCIVASFKLSCV